MATDNHDIAKRIDARRIELGITVSALAVATRIPQTTLQRRLAGDEKLLATELLRLARALDVRPSTWIDEVAA